MPYACAAAFHRHRHQTSRRRIRVLTLTLTLTYARHLGQSAHTSTPKSLRGSTVGPRHSQYVLPPRLPLSLPFPSLVPSSPRGWRARTHTQDSSYALPPELTRPLRPLWITPASARFPDVVAQDASSSFLPVICVSASRAVDTGTERRAGGFSYVQGSGDDHELWGQVCVCAIIFSGDHLMAKMI